MVEIMNSVGMCIPLNKLSIESEITEIKHRDQKLSAFFRGSVAIISDVPM